MKTINSLLCGLMFWGVSTHLEVSVAQVIPDNSLAGESSVVIPSVLPTGFQNEVVVGGARRDANLFHSFETFNISGDQALYFLEPEGVDRIFTRVTGLSPSDIKGTLGVVSRSDVPGDFGTLGSADLFLINANGITFGQDAQLQLRGSFTASTASDIQFVDDSEFSVSLNASTPILTNTVPVGLGLRQASSITVENEGRAIVDNIFLDNLSSRTGLAVLPGQTIALVGGGINLDGGIIRTPGGNVELASVEDGFVGITQGKTGPSFSYESVEVFDDLTLSRLSLIETSGIPAGEINLTGSDVAIGDGSLAIASNAGSAPISGINVFSSTSFSLGQSEIQGEVISGLYSNNAGLRGGDISLEAPQILIQNGGQVLLNNLAGEPGAIFINAVDYLRVEGFSSVSERLLSVIGSNNGINPATSGGDIIINAGEVSVIDGAQISALASDGRTGSLDIEASEITVRGALPTLLKSSIIGIAIGGDGDSGQLFIDTDTLRVLDGGTVGTVSIGEGNAGDTIIRASESIEIAGTFAGQTPSNIDSSVSLVNPITRIFLQTLPSIDVALGGQRGSTPAISFDLLGRSGNISIDTPDLSVRDSGDIRVQNDGTGDAGNLSITAEKLQVISDGTISAITRGGQGGSIVIDSSTLFADTQSLISASAAGNGTGGNITIDTDAIALLNESTIAADAEAGSGGQVQLQSNTLFQSPSSAITATSEGGPALDGSVEITVQEESSRTEEQLSQTLELPSTAVACTRASEEGFAFTGRGGLPLSSETLRRSWEGWNTPTETAPLSEASQDGQIIEAQGFLPNGDGTVRFVDQATLFNTITASGVACVANPPA